MKILIDVTEQHRLNAQDVNFYYLRDGEHPTSKTYTEIVAEAKKIATYLSGRFEAQSRIMLIYPPCLDFIASFLGCLYAGMIAVPAYPLQNPRHAYRLHSIIDSCEPKLILGNQNAIDGLSKIDSLTAIEKIATESLLGSSEVIDFKVNPAINESTIAFLQYTSGSTGKPKGVMVTNGNLMSNLSSLKTAWGLAANKTSVLWLPFQHDLGLIGGVLSSLYNKNNLVLLPPAAIIQQPYRWLKALTDFEAYFTAGPNFAYQLCVNKISEDELSTLDLSSVGYALAAAEPNRYETMEQFCSKFAACGFKREAYSVGYGLAENTLHVTTNTPGKLSKWMRISQKNLAEGRIVPSSDDNDRYLILSAGTLHPDHEIAIVNPETKVRCATDEIGEIWVHSRSVANGYWENPEASKQTFNVCIEGEETPYLRTGDLGFINDNELYVTGRQKDLIIIDGRNIYPQDLEAVVDACHEFIQPGCSAAFSVDTGAQEAIVVCAEVKRTALRKDLSALIPAIRHAIAERYEVAVHDIKLLKPHGSFKTTSGKIQRKATQKAWLENTLECVGSEATATSCQDNVSGLATDLQQILSEVLGLKKIGQHQRFSELGGTSMHATMLYQKLQDYFGPRIVVSQTVAFDYPTLAELIEFALQAQNQSSELTQENLVTNTTDKIAIIGIGCRLPGKIHNMEDLWTLLREGVDAIEPIPSWRWDISHYDDELKNRIKQAGVLEDIDQFDAAFFNISPKEARQMDPQHRLLLEIAWEALENAAIPAQSLNKEKVGVYIGSSSTDYRSLIVEHNDDADIDPYFVLDNASSVMAGRIAYYLGTQGPAETIDTACSSSLVALNEACEAMQAGKIKMALVGAVNVILYPENSVGLARANMLSPTGRCHTFSQNADGYVRSEGCAVVVLKHLSDAVKDGDIIHAVIQSVAVNQDGASSGLTVPNLKAQENLLHDALKQASLVPNDIDYLEAHGSATVLGDPIEFGAINAVFGHQNRTRPLYVGSIKSSLGHLEAASGMGGLLKTIAAFQHKELPANIHLETINNKLDLDATPIEVVQVNRKWHAFGKPRLAGVSSFGFSGTNAHVILEEAPVALIKNESVTLPQEQVFVLSAKTQKSLDKAITSYLAYLEHSDARIEDICYTAAIGREHFAYRLALLVKDKADLLTQLKASGLPSVEVSLGDEVVTPSDTSALANDYLSGKRINWEHYYKPWLNALRKVRLPTYCFDSQHYWLDVKKITSLPYGKRVHAFLGAKLPNHSDEVRFINQFDLSELDYLKDHCLFGHIVFPGAGFVESALACGVDVFGDTPLILMDFSLLAPLDLGRTTDYEVTLDPAEGDLYRGVIYARHEQAIDWIHQADFSVQALTDVHPEAIDLNALKGTMERIDVGLLYERFKTKGLQYGEAFQSIKEAFKGKGRILVAIKNEVISRKGYYFHPALLDGVFQAVALAVDTEQAITYIPAGMECMYWYEKAPGFIWAEITLLKQDAHSVTADIKVTDDTGVTIAQIQGFLARAITQQGLEKLLVSNEELGRYIEDYEVYALPAVEKAHDGVSNNEHVVFIYEENFSELVAFAKRILVDKPLSFTLVTRHAFSISAEDEINPDHTKVLGFWKSLRQEAGSLCYLIDTRDSQQDLSTILELIRENALPEPQIILRDQVYVPRLLRMNDYAKGHHQLLAPEAENYLISDVGVDTLHWGLRDLRPLAADEIKIHILATALNFRDVLKAMNLYPGDSGDFGYECVGEVIASGDAVQKIKLGDQVIVVGQGLLGGEAVVKVDQAVLLPKALSPAQGASIPIVFLTANYGLNQLANIKKGQKVLIHAASGGVGLAAIELAKREGAEVYATASRPKQAYLKDTLGLLHVYDSRSTQFSEQILADTGGQGVDIVLNSLTGEGYIPASLACLKEGGVFLEISKLNVYTKEQMGSVRPDVHYHLIEIDKRIENEPKQIQKELDAILALFASDELRPLPITQYPVVDVIDAFHYLQQSKQIGKVVLINPKPFEYASDATYLITGGTGGLGLALARHLLAEGVTHLALTSRSKASKELVEWMDEQGTQGVTVTHYQVDVVDKKALNDVFAALAKGNYPLKGIFHAAGLLKDGLLSNLSEDDFAAVLAPKVKGSLNLHELSENLNLDCFVLFSSVVSLLGSAGQSNYAAANSFMDGLAIKRRILGLPALSVNWGPFAKAGMAAGLEALHRAQGMNPLDASYAFETLDALLATSEAQVGVMNSNWSKVAGLGNPYFAHLVIQKIRHQGEWQVLLENTPQTRREQVLTEKIKQILADVLTLNRANEIDVNKGFFDLGMDSLMAVEFKNKLQEKLGSALVLTNTVAFDYSSVKALQDYLLQGLAFKEKKPTIIQNKDTHDEAIAIIGLSGEFPGANNLDAFWQMLVDGKEGVTEVPATRWDVNAYYDSDPNAPGKMISRRGGFINGIDQFDAAFFFISPKEANYLDPQQRLLLKHSWLALESAGISPQSLNGSDTGVFIGISTSDYSLLINKYVNIDNINAYIGTGNASSTASGRISYFLGLQGPNMAIDTACSSSLAALNEACERLQNGECSSAIVGGVSALLSPELSINFSKAGMLAPDGKCKTFDEHADGYVRGEGCGIVILKRLSDALQNKDKIWAVIKSSGINQDGASSGLTVPSGQAQERLLSRVLAQSHLSADDIDYVECHGTGTRLGDPIEVHAIGAVYGQNRTSSLKLGSVKTNIGHLEAAAGIAGLIKVILSLKYNTLPKHLNFNQLNSNITLNFPAEIVTQTTNWQRTDKTRHAALSSFGFSGTNVHVILEEAPNPLERDENTLPEERVFVLSARTQKSLDEAIASYIAYLEQGDERIDDICYTAATGRSHFAYRLALFIKDKDDLLKRLKAHELSVSAVPLDDEFVTSSDINVLVKDYLSGKKIDWDEYYKPYLSALCIVSLPTYCFDTQRYWIEVNKAIKPSTLFEVRWIEQEPGMHQALPSQGLVLVNDGLRTRIASKFNEISWDVKSETSWNKGGLEDWLAVHPDAPVLWVVDSGDLEMTEMTDYYANSFGIVKQLSRHSGRVIVLTCKAEVVVDEDDVDAYAAGVRGLLRSLALEQSGSGPRYCLIDVDKLDSDWLGLLSREDWDECALRQGCVYGRMLQGCEINLKSEAKSLDEAGFILITGGLGALGLLVAEHLIREGARYLCLVGRRAPDDLAAAKIAAFRAEGVDIVVESLDVSDEASVVDLIAKLNQSKVSLSGVIHAAGVLHDGLLMNLDWPAFSEVFASKIRGALNLHKATQSLNLSYFIMFSSIASSLGSPGQTNYALANAFLDGLAHHRRYLGLEGTSINWGPWQESGMATRGDGYAKVRRERSGIKGLSNHEALSVLSQVMQSNNTELTVANIDWKQLAEQAGFQNLSLIKGLVSPVEIPAHHPRFLLLQGKNATQRRASIMNIVREHLAAVLGAKAEVLPNDVGFFALGMDSLMAIDLRNRLQTELGELSELPASFVLDYPTLNDLLTYFDDLLSLQQKNTHIVTLGDYQLEPIAVIGMAGVFPGGCASPEELWELLIANRSGIVDIPASRWDAQAYYDSDKEKVGKMYVLKGGFIDGIEYFDSDFFNISPREALFIDPQQRLLLETSWHALEDSGNNPSALRGSDTGIIVGASQSEYGSYLLNSGVPEHLTSYTPTGASMSAISGRVAYALDLQGPCMTVDTACSSSLVAIHNACEALRSGNASLMLAGGVNLTLNPDINISLCRAHMLAEDGLCKTFDAAANGYVRSEGCGVVVLKRLSDAIRDGDRIYGVILASTVNQDGASGGLTVPNRLAQERLLRRTLAKARLIPNDVGYIEVHGTGTELGDPIEAGAISSVYGEGRSAQNPLVISAVKSQIGHLEAAAGVTGVIKGLLSFEHQRIPGVCHFNRLNPKITLKSKEIIISHESQPWQEGYVQRMGINSFGFTGTNAHVILEAPPAPEVRDKTINLPNSWPFVLSAKSAGSLVRLIDDYIDYLSNKPETFIGDVCYTAAIGRSHFNYRLALQVKDSQDLLTQLQTQSLDFNALTLADEVVFDADPLFVTDAYRSGLSVNWPEVFKPYVKALRKISLPVYCFDKKRYWIEKKAQFMVGGIRSRHVLLQHEMVNFKERTHIFTTELSNNYPDFLPDHFIYNELVVAGATYISAMMSFAFQVLEVQEASLHSFEFIQPLVIAQGSKRTIQIVVKEDDDGYAFEIYSVQPHKKQELIVHATGRLKLTLGLGVDYVSLDELRSRCTDVYSGEAHRDHAAGFGLQLGGHFRWLKEVYYNESELLAALRAPSEGETVGYELYPGLVDSSFQAALVWLKPDDLLQIPLSVGCIDFKNQLPQWIYIKKDQDGQQYIEYLDANGLIISQFKQFTARVISEATMKKVLKQQIEEDNYCYQENYEPYVLPVTSSAREASVLLYASSRMHEEWDGFHEGMVITRGILGGLEEISNQHVVFVYEEKLNDLFILMQRMLATPPLSFTLITKQAYCVGEQEPINPQQTSALGLWRTFKIEAGILPTHAVDVVDYKKVTQILPLIIEGALAEPQLIIRDILWVPRLVSMDYYKKEHKQLDIPQGNQYLVSKLGVDGLHWVEGGYEDLGPNQLRLKVEVTSLNFRDVLKAMDLYPGDAGELGYECVGEVLAVGQEVKGIRPGSRVIVMGQGLLAGEAVVDAVQVCALPKELRPIDGAAIPIVYLTADYGLNQLAKLKPGQKVLIHAATGGVGLAAIAFSRLAGAQVYATASVAKQAYLREVLGIENVYDSRSTDFGAAILSATSGAGVDVVLNSLTSDGFIESSLSCLKQGGVFLEIGKINIYSSEKMKAVRPDVDYHIIETDQRMKDEPILVQKELNHILSLFSSGQLKPLPVTTFSVSDTISAFHYLQRAKQIGKVVITYPASFQYQSEGSYLITGGTGGLGFALAEHLIAQGVKHLVLTSRSPASEVLLSWMQKQGEAGFNIRHYQADVSDRQAIAGVFQAIAKSTYPLKGIFHAAGMLHDGMLMNLTQDDFNAVLAPKVLGSQYLDELSRGSTLDCFVLFSSVASLLGNSGQANYAAANAFMDGLAQARKHQGLPALSINWGPFAKVGMAAHLGVQHGSQGFVPLETVSAFHLMDTLLSGSAAQLAVMQVDWQKVPDLANPYLNHLVMSRTHSEGEWLALLDATPVTQREQVLGTQLKQLVAQVLSIQDPTQIDANKGFFEMGMDSLIAVDLKNKLQNKLGKQIKNTIFFDFPTITRLVKHLKDEIGAEYFEVQTDVGDEFLNSFENELNDFER